MSCKYVLTRSYVQFVTYPCMTRLIQTRHNSLEVHFRTYAMSFTYFVTRSYVCVYACLSTVSVSPASGVLVSSSAAAFHSCSLFRYLTFDFLFSFSLSLFLSLTHSLSLSLSFSFSLSLSLYLSTTDLTPPTPVHSHLLLRSSGFTDPRCLNVN